MSVLSPVGVSLETDNVSNPSNQRQSLEPPNKISQPKVRMVHLILIFILFSKLNKNNKNKINKNNKK